jgi:hypothetical protein
MEGWMTSHSELFVDAVIDGIRAMISTAPVVCYCPLPLPICRYKYLVHVDGQGLSSRLDQLLPLGSLVLKEESGYTTYYHHLLK